MSGYTGIVRIKLRAHSVIITVTYTEAPSWDLIFTGATLYSAARAMRRWRRLNMGAR